MRKTLTDKGVASLKARPQRYAFPDPQLVGHYVRVQPSGAKSFATVARDPNGKQVWTNIGAADVLGIDAAREQAREAIKRVRAGLPAVESAADTFAEVSDGWLKRHVEPKGLRTAPEIRRLLDKHILPAWQSREFISIRRSDVAGLLDKVQDNHGPRQADCVLDVLRAVMFWYATRHDTYAPPIVRGMKRQSTKEQARTRILTDPEICAIWKLAKDHGTFGAILQIALLTAQRREKIVSMKWEDIDNGVWTVPAEAREKGNIGSVKLPKMVLDIIDAQPRLASNGYVFAGRGAGYFNSLSKPKLRLDAQMPKGTKPWIVHDLRRTSRSLLSRADVSSEHSERVMGHVLPGVEGTYDRHQYDAEKAAALAKLATLIDGVINQRDNVLPMKKEKRS
jgi:integrase